MVDLNPESYAHQEGIGQPPNYVTIGTVRLYAGGGVPAATLGRNGDSYFQSDGTQAANTVIYHKESNVWVALVTT